ncbi:hypothetical protein EJ05DRAFT_479794 [Pseudovirgaria hyperparasitica]|uniref:DUF4187 domain-containing protein n=1 Tax=Pseudovirgaria hyperparasitica TaxID=470096 RepID=A0A6A6VWP1_9PEZI|nr:uncharacterized protein EJ05DRAFT_479794 [Pseudovirgaria hyperparasitica]KAF2754269.1 hypothetical protein EJ05DRAFT_479794 [Pseudovirgaria hyperparasitica]
MDSEKKRKIREAAESAERTAKKVKADEGDYRERMRMEREERKLFGQLKGAQKVAEKLDMELEGQNSDGAGDTEAQSVMIQDKPLRQINVLYRTLEHDRRHKERDRELRAELQDRLSSLQADHDTDEDEDDRVALGKTVKTSLIAEDIDEEDLELEQFESLPLSDRLLKVTSYLREKHHYCFWCKHGYADDSMDGCPGTTEDDHD